MSLESGIAELTTATNNLITYFNGKKAAIDVAVAAAIAAVPDTARTWYVDQINGLDTNAGTLAAPFKTFGKAITSTPASGFCMIYLTNDYDMATGVGTGVGTVYIVGLPTNGVKPKIKPKYLTTTDGLGVKSTLMAGFTIYLQSDCICFRDLDIVLPTIAGIDPPPNNGRAGAFVRSFAGVQLPIAFRVGLETVNVTMAADWFGYFIGLTASSLIFTCNASTFPSGFGGRYVSNVGPGVLPKDLGHVMSNLASL